MTQKTWFLPPDFTFRPEGEIRLGTILKDPGRPTLSITTVGPNETPSLVLPEVEYLIETAHRHGTEANQSINAGFFAKFVELATGSGNVDVARFLDRTFGTVDHVVHQFSGALSPATVKAIVNLDQVKKYVNGGKFGWARKRPVYIVSGLRIAKDSFKVSNEAALTSSISVEASVIPDLTGAPVPREIGVNMEASSDKRTSNSYNTAAGIVFAYRMHVIRTASCGQVESELFSSTTAFCTGSGGGDKEPDIECVEVIS
ncbi:hypothetical protein MAC_08969 [Metarhizium acridum CQMa 102]|uniref:Uncharacterized protein n=1 Tax=Metarhizium acridum (strain CQMa 102) TaxID=655827 RepID=E9EGH1_METAQ|nr:uncharacterized protein MAC_08969 [Metarhizium acridum CQMa 102]EFY84985.1 hypothetical protein MAC_08969 [Metarhizium acridum CQMa 102]